MCCLFLMLAPQNFCCQLFIPTISCSALQVPSGATGMVCMNSCPNRNYGTYNVGTARLCVHALPPCYKTHQTHSSNIDTISFLVVLNHQTHSCNIDTSTLLVVSLHVTQLTNHIPATLAHVHCLRSASMLHNIAFKFQCACFASN